MTPTPSRHACPARRRSRALPLACFLSLTLAAAAHAAGPAGNNPLEAPPALQSGGETGSGTDPRSVERSSAGELLAGSRVDAAARRDAPGLAAHAGDPDWRVRLHLAPPPGDRPSSATLAQRAVVVTMSRSF